MLSFAWADGRCRLNIGEISSSSKHSSENNISLSICQGIHLTNHANTYIETGTDNRYRKAMVWYTAYSLQMYNRVAIRHTARLVIRLKKYPHATANWNRSSGNINAVISMTVECYDCRN